MVTRLQSKRGLEYRCKVIKSGKADGESVNKAYTES